MRDNSYANCPLIFKHLVEMIDGGENVSDSNNDVKKIRVSNSKASTFFETSYKEEYEACNYRHVKVLLDESER
ncbi:hypothetical protein RhiirA4_459237 [Rhizophagus irregularis]|uniref:Uncharacterized protein n=1 Tax=Rhizophagus irregularis TaxID=588596 RepID=A0A2I1GDX0_9GLOM|nr:hypothetical protein RhiirA4_459237 [Rhizophagus irregularis]